MSLLPYQPLYDNTIHIILYSRSSHPTRAVHTVTRPLERTTRDYIRESGYTHTHTRTIYHLHNVMIYQYKRIVRCRFRFTRFFMVLP